MFTDCKIRFFALWNYQCTLKSLRCQYGLKRKLIHWPVSCHFLVSFFYVSMACRPRYTQYFVRVFIGSQTIQARWKKEQKQTKFNQISHEQNACHQQSLKRQKSDELKRSFSAFFFVSVPLGQMGEAADKVNTWSPQCHRSAVLIARLCSVSARTEKLTTWSKL